MIVNNAASRCDVGFWTKHLQNDKKNERAELMEIRGLAADNLRGALLEMQQDARHAPRCKNFMYHADFNPRRDERLTEQQWDRMFEIFEKHRGIPEGQPRVVIEHEKNGRVHRHVIWQRVDLETLRAFPDGLDWKVAHAAAREIEKELGLQKTIGPLDREEGTPRPPRAPEAWEMYRGMKTGIDPRDITAQVTGLFHQSDNGKAFQAALEEQGYILLKGDRRGFVILDAAGKEHSLVRRLDGINTKQLKAFMHDVDLEALPTVQQGKELYQQRKETRLQDQLAEVQKEIEREERRDLPADRIEAARERMAAFGFDGAKPSTQAKWQELETRVDAGRITYKDCLREMADYLWHEADRERRAILKEERSSTREVLSNGRAVPDPHRELDRDR